MPAITVSHSEQTHDLVSSLAGINGAARSKRQWAPPSTNWTPMCHPRVDEITKEVDGYFLEHWPFPNKKAEQGFRSAAFSRVTCLYFPLARDDSIHFACRLLTVLFLIDGD